MYSHALLPLLAGLAAAAPVTTTTDAPADINPTPDALPLDFLASVEIPTYSTLDGASSQSIPYVASTAIASAAAAVSETPLSVFPAVSTIAINAAGDGADSASATPTATAVKRDASRVQKRDACASQAVITDLYNVDVSSAANFRKDTNIATAAKSANTPDGYYNNFVNLGAANSAYAYLGYTVVTTGYDVAWCAKQCTKTSGCLSFNIYFERDPTLEPADACPTPDAFANIKCSFWGSALDSSTATNTGQWRSQFEVAIAGSNAYTSNNAGGPIAGWSGPANLGAAVMQAPLYDAANTWTYLGYKLFQGGPYNVSLCAAACNAQTEYNVAHPPATGYAPLCAAFGSYQLTVTNRTTGCASVVGQMCTMYTSNWDPKYATNTVAWNDALFTKYTYSLSYFYSRPDLQPVSAADLTSLGQDNGAFCTSYLQYTAPTSTATATVTSKVQTVTATAIATATTSTTTTVTVTTTPGFAKRQDAATSTDASVDSIIVSIVTASSELIPAPTATLNSTATSTASVSIDIASDAVSAATDAGSAATSVDSASSATAAATTFAKRQAAQAISTPSCATAWNSLKISAACSHVATGTVTVTSTTSLAAASTATTTTTATTTKTNTITKTTTVSAPTSTIIVSGKDGNCNAKQAQLTLPWSVSSGSGNLVKNNVVTLDLQGWIGVNNPCSADRHDWDKLQLYLQAFYSSDIQINAANQYIKASLSGSVVGQRTIEFEWLVGTSASKAGTLHFSALIYEARPGVVDYVFHDHQYNYGLSATNKYDYKTFFAQYRVPLVGQTLADSTPLGTAAFSFGKVYVNGISDGLRLTSDANALLCVPA